MVSERWKRGNILPYKVRGGRRNKKKPGKELRKEDKQVNNRRGGRKITKRKNYGCNWKRMVT